jgi:hypothetical protein
LSSAQKLSSSGSSFAFCLVDLFTIPIPAKTHYLFPFSHVRGSFLIIKLVLFLPYPSNIPHYLQLFSVQRVCCL